MREGIEGGGEAEGIGGYTLSSSDKPEWTGVPVEGMYFGSIPSTSKLRWIGRDPEACNT